MRLFNGQIRTLLIVLALCLWRTSASAQTSPDQTALRQTVLSGAKVHTVAGEVIDDAVIVVGKDGKIAAVGGPDTKVPEGAQVVDVTGKVITPGLVDAFTSLGVVEIWQTGSTVDHAGSGDPVRAAFSVSDGFNPNSVLIPITRTGGVTSVLVAPGGGLVSGKAAWARLGAENGAKQAAFVDDASVAMVVNHGERGARAAGGSRGAAMESLRELYDDVVFYRDNKEGYDQNRSRKLAASRLDLENLGATLERGMPVLFRVNRASDIRVVLKFADEAGLKPIIVGGAEAWQVADELAERKVPVVVEPTLNLPERFEKLGARADNAALLKEAGVPVVLSTFSTHNVRKLRQAAGNAVRAGMSHADALEAITAAPARALGRDDIGTVEVGKAADLVVWSGDPFELSTRVERLYVDGAETSLDNNRQHKLFERYRELPRRGEPAERD
jgi:imidazolonepropionase-like amidohydrolase